MTELVSLKPHQFEDPLLTSVRVGLSERPECLEKLQVIASHNLITSQPAVIAVRSMDVVTFLAHYQRGKIPLHHSEMRAKRDGWFYVTPLSEDYEIAVGLNESLYGLEIPLKTVLGRQIFPLLQDEWLDSFRRILRSGQKLSLGLVIEDISRNLRQELLSAKQLGSDNKSNKQFKILDEILNLLPPKVDSNTIIRFLGGVLENRKGIMIGFNKHIVQGEVAMLGNDPEGVIDDLLAPEAAIKPESGFIDLSESIEVIEPRGDYEKEILKELKII